MSFDLLNHLGAWGMMIPKKSMKIEGLEPPESPVFMSNELMVGANSAKPKPHISSPLQDVNVPWIQHLIVP